MCSEEFKEVNESIAEEYEDYHVLKCSDKIEYISNAIRLIVIDSKQSDSNIESLERLLQSITKDK